MSRKFLVCVASVVLVMSVAAGGDSPDVEFAPGLGGPTPPTGAQRAPWDTVWAFTTVAGGQPGVETDGQFIYTSSWAGDTFSRFHMSGSWYEDFTIQGVSNIRDMAYDGTYFYGSPASMTIFVMDLANESLIGTIPMSCSGITGVRHIAYDPTLDGGAGGFWIGNWSELGAITMAGSQIYGNIAGNASCYGSARDPYSTPGSPRLLLFQQTGSLVDIHAFDINSLTYQGVVHSATDVPGYDGTGIAGGLCVFEDIEIHKVLLIGNIQQSLNVVFAYELAPWWPVVWSFATHTGGEPGVETDGEFIYTATWTNDTFSRYAMDGTWLEDFTIPGVSEIRDMAFDGHYFYGSPASMTIYVMDLASESLVATIPVACDGITGVRHIAYDPILGGGGGGFWIGNWNELGAVSMEGIQLVPNIPGNQSCYGSAWDPYSRPGHPRLLLFRQTGSGVDIHGFDTNTLAYQGVVHPATDVPGYGPLGIAGGLCIHEDPTIDQVLLIGNIQQDPNLVFAYGLRPMDLLFADGFECGDCSAW